MARSRLMKFLALQVLVAGVVLLGLKVVLDSRNKPIRAEQPPGEQGRTGFWSMAGRRESQERSRLTHAAVPVEVARVAKQRIDTYLLNTCTLTAEAEVEVYAKTSGELMKLFVEEGDMVGEGDPLAKLDDSQQKLNFEDTRIRMENAKVLYERAQVMQDKNIISAEELEQTKLSYDTATVGFQTAQLQLEYTTIKSPITGTVTSRMVERGEMVYSNQSAFYIADYDPILACVYVPEKDLHKIAIGRQVKVQVESMPNKEFDGKVTLISPVVDSESGTVKVRVDIPNPPDTGLRPGMFATSRLIIESHPDALVIPKKALIIESDSDEVFVARETVKLGLAREDAQKVTMGSEATITQADAEESVPEASALGGETQEAGDQEEPGEADASESLKNEQVSPPPSAATGEQGMPGATAADKPTVQTAPAGPAEKSPPAPTDQEPEAEHKTAAPAQTAVRGAAEVMSVIIPDEEDEDAEIVLLLPDGHGLKEKIPVTVTMFPDSGGEITVELDPLELRTQAFRKRVEVGFSEGNEVEILSGLNAGERVITVGNEELRNGTIIEIVSEEVPGQAGGEVIVEAPTPRTRDFSPMLGRLKERLLANPKVKEEYEKALAADPELASDPQKFMAFMRNMREQGLIESMRPERGPGGMPPGSGRMGSGRGAR